MIIEIESLETEMRLSLSRLSLSLKISRSNRDWDLY